jgi:hypothetical protein
MCEKYWYTFSMTRRNQPARDPEQEHRAEAARLRFVDRDTQRQIIAIHRNTAENRKLPKEDRDFARQRADALERILGLAPTGRKPFNHRASSVGMLRTHAGAAGSCISCWFAVREHGVLNQPHSAHLRGRAAVVGGAKIGR